MARIVEWIGFIASAIVGNSANDFFGIIPAGEGALGVCPIGFGLAAVACGEFARPLLRIANVPRRLGRILLDPEILRVIGHVGLVMNAHDERLVVFSIRKSRQATRVRSARLLPN
jgi:hypothetical protein